MKQAEHQRSRRKGMATSWSCNSNEERLARTGPGGGLGVRYRSKVVGSGQVSGKHAGNRPEGGHRRAQQAHSREGRKGTSCTAEKARESQCTGALAALSAGAAP